MFIIVLLILLIKNIDNIIDSIINDNILTNKTKQLLIKYQSSYEYEYLYFNNKISYRLKFKELLSNVWTLINTLDSKDEIKSILNININESECKCSTCIVSSLLNCLSVFTELVNITMDDNEQIENIIIMIKKN
jgi:hypothetical protein